MFDGKSLITPQAIALETAARHGEFQEIELATASAEIALVLHVAQQRFQQAKDPVGILHRLVADLHKARSRLDLSVWQRVVPLIQNHPICEYVLQDPFTCWSFQKPRGYSGDAHLLDFIYGHPDVLDVLAAASPLGRMLYSYTKDSPASVAVRERRDLLTQQVDQVAAERGGETEILTVAAGHLREANRSMALQSGDLKRWVALDQDPLSVGSMVRDFRGTRVEAVDGSVRGLLGRAAPGLGTFDFIYAAGLYDYLADNVAAKLTQRCLQMLKPGGTFLFANFARDIADDGYMETFMNWALLLRSEAEMWGIINASVDRNTVEAKVFFGANRNIVYGVIRKRE